MADTTKDIWNDNDGEEEQPRKPRHLRNFLIFFLTLAVVLGVVLVAAYRDGTEDAPYEDDGIYSKKVPPSPWARATPPTSASRKTRSPSGRETT